ncbi:hypothetical protein ACWDTI_05520 [Gordonia sp. NPDC003424]
MKRAVAVIGALAAAEALLIHLGRTYGASATERALRLPGDDAIRNPTAITDHAATIAAAPEDVWPWLVQMGWGRAGWYTARWVDRLLFPANGPSADRVIPELQGLQVGDFIPDGPPETKCGFIVDVLDPGRALVLHSTSHLPRSWRAHASVDWTWTFVLEPLDGGRHTRCHFRSRWSTAPRPLSLASWLVVVPADFVMSRDMLRGITSRVAAAGGVATR